MMIDLLYENQYPKILKNTPMKKSKLILLCCLSLLGLVNNSFGQITLPEVRVLSLNYKYLKSVYDSTAAQPVKLLERRAASFDLKNSEFYEEEYDSYFISFFLPEGQVLAFYDNTGKMMHSAEKFKNVALPRLVQVAVANKYPGWAIAKDIYLVNYVSDGNESKKVYKLILENNSKRIRTKLSEKGEFLD
jgi:hypothetical protein